MEVESNLVPEQTLEDFADEHGLTMVVHERGAEFVAMKHIGPNARFYAMFKNAEVKDNDYPRGTFGDGATPVMAIAAYAQEISERLLVVDSGKPERREIKVPRLVSKP